MASSHLQYGTILECVPTFITDSLVDKSTSIVLTFDSERTRTSDLSLELEFESSTVSLGPVVRSRACGSRYHSLMLLESVMVVVQKIAEKAPH